MGDGFYPDNLHQEVPQAFTMSDWVVLGENDRIHMVELVDSTMSIKGLGVFNPMKILGDINIGEEVLIGQKYLMRMPARLPELVKGMQRRAQTISSKDAGALITRMGIGPGDCVLDAGLGSAGLSLHLARVMGSSGHLLTIEPREEHAEVGLSNLARAADCFPEFPKHDHCEGLVHEVVEQTDMKFDAVILDMADHSAAIKTCAPLLKFGARMACYAPSTSQLESCWQSCIEAGLEVEWAAEMIERPWGRASKGGVRPTKGTFGHTAFLLIAINK